MNRPLDQLDAESAMETNKIRQGVIRFQAENNLPVSSFPTRLADGTDVG